MDARLGEYVRGQWPALVRYATFLCGDVNEAEELVQSALVKVATRWPFVSDKENPHGYVRRAVLRTFLNKQRRLWGRETSYAELPEPVTAEPAGSLDDSIVVRNALLTLPPRQRAVLVLRYFDDLTEAQTAETLGCSVGTVKSQSSKALAKLRAALEPDPTGPAAVPGGASR